MDCSNGKIWTVPYVMALINNFFLFLVFYALLTLLPVYVMDEMNGTEEQAGLVTTAFLLSAILIRPFSGVEKPKGIAAIRIDRLQVDFAHSL